MGVCGLEKDIEYRRTVMEGYKNEIEPLFWYVPWLESRYGKKSAILLPATISPSGQ